MELCESIIDGDRLPAGIKPAIKTKLANFVGVVRKLRRAAQRVCAVPPGISVIAVLTS
jgi:DNA helicase-2/ATP-dependent DNA helicase PcrA